MKKIMWLIPIVAALVFAGLLTLSLTAKRPNTLGRTADGQLAACPESPNCVCSFDADADHAIEPFTMTGDPKSELKRLAKLISDHQRAEVVTLEDDYLHAEFTSQLFRYVDDVEFLADSDGTTLHVRSASRVGHSDLGANRKRIAILRIQFHSGDRNGDSPIAQSSSPDDAATNIADPDDDADSSRRNARIGFETVDDSDLVRIRSTKATATITAREAAEKDIADGKLILRGQPLPNPPWWNAYTKLLRDEYGITLEVVKHASAKLTDDDLEYNTIMKTEIERKFGTGIIGKTRTRAKK